MKKIFMRALHLLSWLLVLFFPIVISLRAQTIVTTNITVRVMASNLSSGNNQRYETAGLNILKGLKPDIVAMQEFNCSNSFGINTPAALRSMIDETFGTNFVYYREPFTGNGDIPNGILSRYPIVGAGSWPSDLGNRGYAWARLDVPGTNDLYVVSAHLKASNDSNSIVRRSAETVVIKSNILASFPANAWIIVAGDLNVYSEAEDAIATLTSFLSDNPVPADLNGGTNTNQGRTERYDRVLPSFSMTNTLTPSIFPSHIFTNGLVFVSTNYTPLSDVSPVQFGDSLVSGMQHMAVLKDFKISYTVTNSSAVPQPYLVIDSANVVRWHGLANLSYTVQGKTNLVSTNWLTIGTALSSTTNVSFTNQSDGAAQRFYRIVYP